MLPNFLVKSNDITYNSKDIYSCMNSTYVLMQSHIVGMNHVFLHLNKKQKNDNLLKSTNSIIIGQNRIINRIFDLMSHHEVGRCESSTKDIMATLYTNTRGAKSDIVDFLIINEVFNGLIVIKSMLTAFI